MFGINDWQQVGQIAQGWTNDLLKREQELFESRMKICKECPLYNENTDRCDVSRCINIKTNEMALGPGKDIVCGCNCYMNKKTRVPSSHCVMKKW